MKSKFCPFRSTADQKVMCEKDCALYAEENATNGYCAIFHIAKGLYEATEEIQNIRLTLAAED